MGPVIRRIALLTVLAGVPGAPAMAQPCNPVIDGTYCAEQGVRRSGTVPSDGTFGTMQGIARSMTPWEDQPGTLGAITFRGGQTCMGLFRRGSCS
jgi:hypothetical protein